MQQIVVENNFGIQALIRFGYGLCAILRIHCRSFCRFDCLSGLLFQCVQEQEEAGSTPFSGSVQAGVKSGSALPDIFSMMRDTTAEHRAHLFDLNCKICTGNNE